MKFIVNKKLLTLILTVGLGWSVSSIGVSNDAAENDLKRNKLIGNIIKNALETYHYRGMKIDDSVSDKAFDEYIKRIDYGKQFLLQGQVDELKKYKLQIDDQMVSGELSLLKRSNELLKKQVQLVDKFREEVLSKPFDFTKNEKIELDPEKRKFNRSEKKLKEHWRKALKHASLNRYMSLVEEQKDEQEAAKKDKKKFKPLSEKELNKKARDSVSKKYEKFFSRIKKEDHDDHLEKFYNAISVVFDPHTNYLPPKRKEDFDIDISGSLEGIGAVLQEDGSYIKVVKIVPGGAAWRQKELQVGDIILMVAQDDGKEAVDLVDMRVEDAVRYIRGPKESKVILTVKTASGTRKKIAIVRDVVQIGESYAKSSVIEMEGLKKKVGYIHLPKFYRDFGNNTRNCSDDVEREVERLKKAKVDGIILDLRNNGGGALEDARQMSGLFLETGPIVQVRNHRGNIEVLQDNDSTVTYDGPLIVMMNRFSASASEILAGAMKDYNRAVLVGAENSHGKGTVQAVLNLNQGPLLNLFGGAMGALKVTIQKFYRVNGSSTQYRGVHPHIVIPDPFDYTESREQDLDYSLSWDTVPSLEYKNWTMGHYNISELQKLSAKRVKKNKRLQNIVKSVEYLKKRKDDTLVSLNKNKVKEEEEKSKKITDKLKYDKVNEKLKVSNFEDSLVAGFNIKKSESKEWKKDLELRKKEWIEGLQKDAGLEEAVFVMNDMLTMIEKKKLSMSSKK